MLKSVIARCGFRSLQPAEVALATLPTILIPTARQA
jgi:hypothetical protein